MLTGMLRPVALRLTRFLRPARRRLYLHTDAMRDTISTPRIVQTATATVMDDSAEFLSIFPDVVLDLANFGGGHDTEDVSAWYEKVLKYNVVGGKLTRGLTVLAAYKLLAKGNRSETDLRLAHLMGWCVELLQAFFLVADDIMDSSETRRGQPCWYRHSQVGLGAINDAFLLESGIYALMEKHHKGQPYYLNCLELFHSVTLKTSCGQALDILTSSAPGIDQFTESKYAAIVKYKTAYYSFHLPVSLAMYMAGITDREAHAQMEAIMLRVGHFFQAQDDYLDCFGDSEVTGKVGTDIQEGKCTWLAVTALKRAREEHRAILQECYGSHDPAKVAKVKALYQVLGLPQLYSEFEEEMYTSLRKDIDKLPCEQLQTLSTTILDKIYHRNI